MASTPYGKFRYKVEIDGQITEAHYFRGRFRVKEAYDKHLLYNERKFEDTLIENDVIFHYKHLREMEKDGCYGHTEGETHIVNNRIVETKFHIAGSEICDHKSE